MTSGRGSFAAVAGALHAVMVGATLQTPFHVIYQRRLGFSEITLTLLYASYTAGTLCALIFFGRLSDQRGRRWTLLPAMA